MSENKTHLRSNLITARQELKVAQLRVAELEAELFKDENYTESYQPSEVPYFFELDYLQEGCQVIGFDWRYLYINDAAARHGHQLKDELLGYTMMERYPGIEKTEMFQRLDNCMQNRTLERMENEFAYSDGTTAWFELNIQPVPAGIFILSLDITERKRAEAARHEALAQLEVFVEHAPAAIAMLDTNMRYLLVSQRWLTDYRLNELDVIGRSHYEIFPDIPEQWKEVHQRCLKGAVESSDSDSFLRADGSLEWLRWEIRPWRHYNGEIGGIFIFSEVITARKQAEKELEALYNATSYLFKTSDRTTIGQQIVEAVVREFDYADCGLMLVDKTQNSIIRLARTGAYSIQPEIPLEMDGLGLVPFAIRTSQTVYVPDVSQDARYLAGEGRTKSELVILLKTSEGVIAVLDLQSEKLNAFSERDQRVLAAFAERAVLAIENMQLYEAVNQHASELELRVVQRTAELNRTKERVEAILNSSLDGILLAHSNLQIQQTNAAFDAMFDCQPDDHFDKPLISLIHAEDQIRLVQLIEAVLADSKGRHGEFRALRKDGASFEAEIGIGCIRTEGNLDNSLVCTIQDITERKTQERQLRYYASMQESVTDAVIATDLAFRVQSWNAAAERIYGWRAEEVIGKPVDDFLRTKFGSDIASNTAREEFLAQGYWSHEVVQHHKDGTAIQVLASVVLFKDDRGQPIGVVAVNHDITERKAQERQLRYHASLQENVSDAVIVLNLEYHIQSWNKAAERIYGWQAEEAVGKSVAEILQTQFSSPSDRERILQLLADQGWWQGEVIQHHKDGSTRHILVATTLLKDEGGIPYGSIAVNHDITHRKQAEEVLRQSEERFALVFRFSPVAIGLTTAAEGRYLDVNDSLLKLLGYSRGEMIGRTASELNVWIAPKEREVVIETIREKGSVRGLEARFRQKTGEICTTLTSIVPVMLNGQSCLLSIVQDITERKAAEEALNAKVEEERQFQHYLEILHEITIELTQVDELDIFYRRVVELGLERFGFERIGLLLYDAEQGMAIGRYGTDGEGKLVAEHHLRFDPANLTGILLRTLNQSERFCFDEDVELYSNLKPIGRGWNAVAALWDGIQNLGWLAIDNGLYHKPVSKPLLDILALYSLTIGTLLARKRGQDALQESEERYRLLAENIADVIMTFSPERVITYMSPSCERLLGYLPEEVEGNSHSEFIHPEDYPYVIDKTRQAVASKENFYTNQFRLRHKTGHYIWYEVRTRIVFDQNTGKVVQFISVLRDITERRHADDVLRESEERFRRAIIDAPFPIMIHADDGEVLHISNAWAEISGYTHADIPTMTDWIEKAYVENSQAVRAVIEKVYTLTRPQSGGEFRIWTKSGEERRWDFISAPLALLPDGRRMISSMAMDITERKHAEETLNQNLAQEREFQNYLKALHDITIELTQLDDLATFFRQVVELGINRLGFERLAVFLYDETDGSAQGTYGIDVHGQVIEESHIRFTPRTDGILLRAFEQTERFYFDDNVNLYAETKPVGTGWNASTVLWNGTQSLGWLVADNLLSQKPATKGLLDILALYALTVGTLLAQKRIQVALQTSEEKFRLLLDAAPVATIISDQAGYIQLVNTQAEVLFGFSRAELIGQMVEVLVPEPVRQHHIHNRAIYMTAPRVRRMGQGLELFAKRKDASEFPVEIELSYIETKDGIMVMSFVADITERKRVAAELERQRSFLRSVIDVSPSMIFVKDYDARFVLVNPMVAKMYDTTVDALIGKTDADFNPSLQEVEGFLEADRRVITSGEPLFIEEPVSNQMGETRWLQTTKVPIISADGSSKYVLGIATDITERRRAEALLRQSMAEIEDLYNRAPCGYHSLDKTGKFLRINDTELQWLGYSREEMIGRGFMDFVTPLSQRIFRESFPIFLEQGWINDLEFDLVHKDGNTMSVLLNGTAVTDENGNFIMSRSTLFDITERKQVDAALRESEEKYRSLIETMRGGLAIYDEDDKITYVNDRFCDLLGYSREEIIGTKSYDYVDELDAEKITAALEQRRQSESSSYELIVRHKDGTPVHLLVSGSPLLDKNDVYTGSFAVMTDITAQKQAEITLRQALVKEQELNELKSRFVSMASHEFRTPLATILALTETIVAYRQKLTDEQIEQRLGKIQHQVGHLKDIMEDMLQLARLQARRAEFNPVRLDLDSLCQSVIDEFQSQIGFAHQLIYTCDATLQEAMLDRKLMRHIINNLVSNAIKYSPINKPIIISLKYRNELLIFKVHDEGIGIPEADLKHLFEPFHRGANVGAISGTGLGLVITKEAVELHGGTVMVESQVGVGTTFTVSIPIGMVREQNHDKNLGD